MTTCRLCYERKGLALVFKGSEVLEAHLSKEHSMTLQEYDRFLRLQKAGILAEFCDREVVVTLIWGNRQITGWLRSVDDSALLIQADDRPVVISKRSLQSLELVPAVSAR